VSAAAVPSGKVIFYDGVYTLGGRILRTALALGMSILLARVLGPHDRGLYALGTGVYVGLVLSVFTGVASSTSYFMLNAEAGRGILRPALLAGLLFCVAGCVPVIAMAELGHNAWAAIPSIALLPCNVATMILLGYALGTKQIRWQTTYAVVSTAALLAGIGIAFVLVSRGAGAAIAAYVLVNAMVALASIAIVMRDSRRLPQGTVPFRAFLAFALRVGVASLVTLLNYRGDLYVVALLASPAVLGEYAVAIAAAESLLVVTQVAGIATSPHVGSMGRTAAAQLTAKCVRATFFFALAICVVFYAVAPYVVRLLYGAAYLPLVPALRVLLFAVLILSLSTPIQNFFTLKLGKPEVALVTAACAAAVCVALSWFLVPRIGMIGAAAATGVAYLISEGIRTTLFLRSTKMRLSDLFVPTRRDVAACTRLFTLERTTLRR